MIFNNPFILFVVVMGIISVVWAHINDGYEMPTRYYSSTQTTVAVIIQFVIVFGAVAWATSH